MGIRNNMWSPHEWETVVRMQADKMTISAIAARIGRRASTVKAKIRFEAMGVEERESRRKRIRGYKAKYRQTIKTDRAFEMVRKEGRPSEASIEDRERRHAAGPRDLTGAFFGDPNRGFSALEGKQGQVSP